MCGIRNPRTAHDATVTYLSGGAGIWGEGGAASTPQIRTHCARAAIHQRFENKTMIEFGFPRI